MEPAIQPYPIQSIIAASSSSSSFEPRTARSAASASALLARRRHPDLAPPYAEEARYLSSRAVQDRVRRQSASPRESHDAVRAGGLAAECDPVVAHRPAWVRLVSSGGA